MKRNKVLRDKMEDLFPCNIYTFNVHKAWYLGHNIVASSDYGFLGYGRQEWTLSEIERDYFNSYFKSLIRRL